MRTRWLIVGLYVLLSSAAVAGAAFHGRRVEQLSLSECRRMALEKNLAFRISRLGPVESRAAVSSERARFDPSLSARTFTSHTQAPNQLIFDPSSGTYLSVATPSQNSLSSALGIEKAFAFGTDMSLNLRNSWSKGSGRSNYSSRLSFDVSQPLLRGFGKKVNESGLRIARNNLDISFSQLESDAVSTVQQVEEAYWDLVSAIDGKRVAQFSLDYARQLLDVSRARAKSGAQAEREVLQAQVGVAIAQQGIISAEAAVRAAEDKLKQLTDLVSDPAAWDISITTVDTPHVERSLPPIDTLMAMALRNSRELYRQRKALESRRLTLRVRKNSLLPSLDATTSLTLNDGARSFNKSVDDIPQASFPSWNAALSLSIPLGNRAALANYRQAAVDLKAAELRLESERQQVRADVRAAVRRVETSREQLAAARETRRLRQANLESEQERLRLGLSTNYDVLRFENDLADARRSVLQARIEHEKALLALDVATGRLLEKRNITLEEEREK